MEMARSTPSMTQVRLLMVLVALESKEAARIEGFCDNFYVVASRNGENST